MSSFPGLCAYVIAAAFIAPVANAQSCPMSGAPLKSVSDAVSDFQKSGRHPAGADCAFEWANNYDPSSPLEKEEIDFFKIAADVQRRASETRARDKDKEQADAYLANEIAIRQRFLRHAMREKAGEQLNKAVVIHVSSVASAMGSRRQFSQLAEYLASLPNVSVIDDEAVKVWLQAVWSCAKWDGLKDPANICARANKAMCKDRASELLDSIAEIRSRNFPRQTVRDIAQLKTFTTAGCLQ